MIGHWKVEIDRFEFQFQPAICIGAVVNLPEVVPVDDARFKTAADGVYKKIIPQHLKTIMKEKLSGRSCDYKVNDSILLFNRKY